MSSLERAGTVGALAAILILGPAAAANAADRIYWGNSGGESISHANVAGSGGGGADIPISGVTVDHPEGLAIDSAAGRIYWVNRDGAEYSIRFANLDGTGGGVLDTGGTPVSEPHGLAIHPAAGRIYWVNWAGDTVYYANLDGSGGGELDVTGALVEQPLGLTVYPALNRVYWANFDGGDDGVDFANLDGTGGGGSLDLTGAEVDMPGSIAIDPQASRVYWGNRTSIGHASLGGGNGGTLDTDALPTEPPDGLAIDPFERTIYWAARDSDAIGFAALGPSGPLGLLDTAGATVDDPVYPVLLQEPRSTVPPSVVIAPVPRTGEAHVVEPHSQALDCNQGQWAPDVLESFLYRAPQRITYQWLRNGAPVPGQIASRTVADLVGSYSCVVTATNGAGSTSVASPGSLLIAARVKLRRVKLNRKRGTATVEVFASGPGSLLLKGRSLVSKRGQIRGSAGTKLLVKLKGRAKKKLRRKGRSRAKLRVAYTPAGGEPIVRTRTIVVRFRKR
jgi:hypothetical protein